MAQSSMNRYKNLQDFILKKGRYLTIEFYYWTNILAQLLLLYRKGKFIRQHIYIRDIILNV